MYNSSLAPDVVKTALDLVFNGEFGLQMVPGLATSATASVFKQDTTDRAAVITEQFMGTGYFESRGEVQDVPSGTARVGNQKTFSVTNWAKSVDISKNLMDDDQHSTIDMLVKNMARNGRLTKDKNAFNVINLGFTTTLTNDGAALFSNSHTTLNGDTVDNLLASSALSEPTLNTAFNTLINQKTQDGTLGGHLPAVLLVPTALFKTACEITKSTLRSGTGNNDMNYYSELYPGLQVLHSPFLGAGFGGSDTSWFLLSKDHSLTRWVRQDIVTDLIDYRTQRNNNYVYKAEYREVVGAISFEGIVGCTA
jgi:phage major head subunit gpT-like protein